MSSISNTTKLILDKLKIEKMNPMQLAATEAINTKEEVVLLSPTGTGKTLAFLLPIISKLDPTIDAVQALIIVPTRELAVQIEQVIREMGTGFKVNAMYGGRSGTHDRINMKHAPAILIGTPGRLAANIFRESFDISKIKTLVLDEFDKSLEMGYDDDMIEILEALNSLDQKILTSATYGVEIPDFVHLKHPETINFLKDEKPLLTIQVVKGSNNMDALLDILSNIGNQPGIIFCNYKDSIKEVSDFLFENKLKHGLFNGDMDQKDRETSLIKFRNGTHQILIATDLAARGIDIPDLKFIIHFQLPQKEEEFIHRNGRTARMKKEGTAYVIQTERERLPDYLAHEKAVVFKRKQIDSNSDWATLFISGGRQDKISKGDIAGLFIKEGKVSPDDVGVIELNRDCSFVGIKQHLVEGIVNQFNNTRLKKKKVRVRKI